MSLNLDEAVQTFVIEAGELLEDMENGLLRIESDPDDQDTINSIFRAAHTIKGSSGMFGLDHMVQFAHVAESVLDRVRDAELRFTSPLVALFLGVRDHLSQLVNLVAEGQEPDDETQEKGQELEKQLRTYLSAKHESGEDAVVVVAPGVSLDMDSSDAVGTDYWHLSLRFSADVLRQGMDPLSFIRYLGTLGKIVNLVTIIDAVPTLQNLDPEASYLGYEISFDSKEDKATIEAAFEFVRDESQIRILPPRSKVSEFLRLIAELPEEDMRLGEILIHCGSLTANELTDALRQQADLKDQASTKPIGEVLVDQKQVRPVVVDAALEKQKHNKATKADEVCLIRINAEKVDQHINLIGELITTTASICLSAVKAGIPDLLETTAVLSNLVEEVRDSALTLRMVQIGATFTKFQRVVRDVSTDLGKDIRLEISGAETELDKNVVEKIGDPLMHLVRNSLDHGIEFPEERLANGKPAQGTLRLNAYHDSGSIVIEVSDDGRGLNKDRILAKAIERGLVKPSDSLSEQEIFNLIFEPGFSTADQVNNLSGRGVGMDVVRRNITSLRGHIHIESVQGVGTSITIRLPLTLAIIDGLLVGVGASSFVVPLDIVFECVELSPEEVATAQGRDQLNLRGEVLPFIRLKQLFDIPEPTPIADQDKENDDGPSEGNDFDGGNISHERLIKSKLESAHVDEELMHLLQPVKRENVVVVQYGKRRVGLVVDNLMGEFQTVIRPLGIVFNGLQGISGFTILGNGQIALILDVPGLVRRVSGRECRSNAKAAKYAMLE